MPKEGNSKLSEVAGVIVIFFGVAGIAFWQFATSFAEQDANAGGPFANAAMFPRLIAWALVVLGGAQILIALFAERRDRLEGLITFEEGTGSEPVDPSPFHDDRYLTIRALACLVVFVLYLIFVTTIGYIASTIVALLTMFLILGTRPLMAFAVSAAATFAAGFVFNTLLNVVLPVGRLGLPTVF